MKAKWLGFFLMLFLCLPGFSSLGEEEIMAPQVQTGHVSLPGEDELFAGYVQKMLYGEKAVFGSTARDQLPEKHQKLYDYLKENIALLASGESDYAVITISRALLEAWGFPVYFTAENTAAVFDAFLRELNASSVLTALLLDCPYELYWYDKVAGCTTPVGVTPLEENEFRLSRLRFLFRVAPAYQALDYEPDFPTLNTEKTGAAARTARKAEAIVARYAEAFDGEKLLGYRNEICALSSYHSDAAEGGDSFFSLTDANPWQLIYVFDEDPETQVVCEGYSKAFQYLCDLTEFDNPLISCYTVTGEIENLGGHMWNILQMEDGNRYLCDLTNSDEGTIGEAGELFWGGAFSGNPQSGYTFFLSGGGKIRYLYRENLPYTQEQLTLSSYQYMPLYTETEINWIPPRTMLTLLPGSILKIPQGKTLLHEGAIHFMGGKADILGEYQSSPQARILISGQEHICAYQWQNGNAISSHAHALLCPDCPMNVPRMEIHSGGEATCVQKAVCQICQAAYGEMNGANHEAAPLWQLCLEQPELHAARYPCCAQNTLYPHQGNEESPCALCGWAGGRPLFSPIFEEGYTLGDILLSLPENQYPVPGSIRWLLPAHTPIRTDASYEWQFIPEDEKISARISGSVIPFPAPEKPRLLSPTENQEYIVFEGDPLLFSVDGHYIVSWQWYMDQGDGQGFIPIIGEDHAFLGLNAKLSENGYRYFCRLSNSKGETESPIITVWIQEPLVPPVTSDSFPLFFLLFLAAASLSGWILISKRKRTP